MSEKKEKSNNANGPKEPSVRLTTKYPLRPDELDCFQYIRNGFCVYGTDCQFNHPVDRMKALRESGLLEVDAEYAVKCKYYALPGGCKYGDDCKFAHYLEKSDIEQLENYHELSDIAELGPISFSSFSAQMEEKECPFYMHHGFCRFLPILAESSDEPVSFSDGSRFHIPAMYFHSQSSTSYDGHQEDLETSTSSSERSAYRHPHSALNNCTPVSYHHAGKHAKSEESSKGPIEIKFPSNIFQAAPTSTYIPTGLPAASSSFASEVKFQQQYASPSHGGCTSRAYGCRQAKNERRPQRLTQCYRPRTCIASTSAASLSPTGLPLRPDRPTCKCYDQYGVCKYGPACQFDHPLDHISRVSAAS